MLRIRTAGWLFVSIWMGGCGTAEFSNKVLIGGTLIDGTGGAPVADSVVVIADGKIRAVGTRAATPIPQDTERMDARGKFVVPGKNGKLIPGQPADLLVLEVDPRTDAGKQGKVERTMLDGKWVPR